MGYTLRDAEGALHIIDVVLDALEDEYREIEEEDGPGELDEARESSHEIRMQVKLLRGWFQSVSKLMGE